MKHRPSKRIIWLVIPVLPLVVMGVGLWFAEQPDAEAIATRGAKAPPEKKFSLANPQSWRITSEWLGDGMDALMDWEYNPWKEQWKRDHDLGSRMAKLAASGRPEDKAELERLKKLGREWYERILARYPDLARPQPKEIPREENGYLQWQELVTQIRENQGKLFDEIPQELMDHLRENTEPDMAAMKAWLDANRARIDEIRAIALLPGHSAAGISDEDRLHGTDIWARYAADALLLDARVAMADGDTARALESIRAVNGLADHLSDNGAPTLIGMLVGATLRSQAQNYVMRSLLSSSSPGSVDLATWQATLNPRLHDPSEMAGILRTEWNIGMPLGILPNLSDTADPATPRDADYLAETCARHMQDLIRQAEGVSLRDYAAAPDVYTPVDHLSRRSRDVGLINLWDPRSFFLKQQEATGLTQAAFAIMNGQPVPTDPVYGQPYKWDPAKRELALPDVPNRPNYKIKPIKVPKM